MLCTHVSGNIYHSPTSVPGGLWVALDGTGPGFDEHLKNAELEGLENDRLALEAHKVHPGGIGVASSLVGKELRGDGCELLPVLEDAAVAGV